jgi:carbon-monoxide dehydrogenase small subunit
VLLQTRINGREVETDVAPRLLLSDFLRYELGLTGTHVACEHGVCGACTVHLEGAPVRSCLLFAVQVHGHDVRTIEDLEVPGGALHPLQEAFAAEHGLQCGFCTPGFIMALEPLMREGATPTDEEIREAASGNICRCTGYVGIMRAVRRAADAAVGEDPA